jgi:glycosyltransferase involved in cell wall biosynthesis
MKIGVFSKIGSSGGSEHRCVEIVNSLVRYTAHRSYLFCEKELNDIFRPMLDERVVLREHLFKPRPDAALINGLYEVDSLIIVNSDSYSFSKLDYWEGRTDHHNFPVDVCRIAQMVFLYNFVISPAKHLSRLRTKCRDIRIVSANSEWLTKIHSEEKFAGLRDLPCTVLASPINPDSVSQDKIPSEKIRIGKHSKAHGYKFDPEHAELIRRINKRYGNRVTWDFMGVPRDRRSEIEGIENVIVRKEYSTSVMDYLSRIDVFLFFVAWSRYEPWSRCVAEAMTSGCAVLANRKAGNIDQVADGEGGFLFSSVEELEECLASLIEDSGTIRKMGAFNVNRAAGYASEIIADKLVGFITAPQALGVGDTSDRHDSPPHCVVIASCWRSGTSWLEDLLGKKVDGSALFGHEQQIFPLLSMMKKPYRGTRAGDRREANTPVCDITDKDFVTQLGLKLNKVVGNLGKYGSIPFNEFAFGLLCFLLQPYRRYRQVVEKSPENGSPASFDLIHDLLADKADFTVVFLFRDYRPYLASCYEKFVSKGRNVLEYYSGKWLEWNAHATDRIAQNRARNILVVEYDDLVEDPEKICSRIASCFKNDPHVRGGTLDKWKQCEQQERINELYSANRVQIERIMTTLRAVKIQ